MTFTLESLCGVKCGTSAACVSVWQKRLALSSFLKSSTTKTDTRNVPGVSADVFITLVLALLSVTAILTAGVDMQSPDPLSTPEALCMSACFFLLFLPVSVWEILFPIPYGANFHQVNKKGKKKAWKKWEEKVQSEKKRETEKRGRIRRWEWRGRGATGERQRLVMPVSIWQVAMLWRWTGGRDGAPDLSQNATCHRAFMSLPAKQYVRGIKNHYALSELCCYSAPQKNNH